MPAIIKCDQCGKETKMMVSPMRYYRPSDWCLMFNKEVDIYKATYEYATLCSDTCWGKYREIKAKYHDC